MKERDLAGQVELESSHLQSKHSKTANHVQSSSASMQCSRFNFPFDLITEILKRLPVKSLLRFECVSKSWLALISSPEFVKGHLGVSANNKVCTHHKILLGLDAPEFSLKDCSLNSLFYDSIAKASDLDLPMKIHKNQPGRFLGSVHGLICFTIIGEGFFIWNPSIRKLKKLCDTRPHDNFMYGFAYDELHSDYKVMVAFGRKDGYEAKIYSSNSDSWRNVDHFVNGMLYVRPVGILVNGKLHWAGATSFIYNSWGIISIDLASGKCGKVEKPNYVEVDFKNSLCLGVLGSDLSVFCYNMNSNKADVWVMKEYDVKESRTKIFTINNGRYFVGLSGFPFFCMSNEGEILIECKSYFMIYNPKDGSIRYQKVINCGVVQEAKMFLESLLYVERLLWPFPVDVPGMQHQGRLK